jgi:hypothetical protein
VSIPSQRRVNNNLLNFIFIFRITKSNSSVVNTQNPFSYRKIINKLSNITHNEISEENFTRRRPRLSTFSSIATNSSESSLEEAEEKKYPTQNPKNYYYEISELKKLLTEDRESEENYGMYLTDSMFYSVEAEQRCRFMSA